MRNSRTSLISILLAAFAASANADAAGAAATVGEMLDMEAAAALAAEQERLHPLRAGAGMVPAPRAGSDSPALAIPVLDMPTATEPRLAAIYGVGERLRADVVIGGVRYTYAHGHAEPIAPRRSVRNASHRLVRIDGACVLLRPAAAGASTRHCIE